MAEYLIIEFSEDQIGSEINNEGSDWASNPINSIRIKELAKFRGPNNVENSNFGLYSSEVMDIFIYFHKDLAYNQLITYYKLARIGGNPKLVKICDQHPNILLSTHSSDFRFYIKFNKSGELEVSPFY